MPVLDMMSIEAAKKTVSARQMLYVPGFIFVAVLAMLALISLLVVTVRVNTAAVTEEFKYLNSRVNRYHLVNSAMDIAAAQIFARPDDQKILEGSLSANYEIGTVTVSFINLAGKVDFNNMHRSYDLIRAVLIRAGKTPEEAELLRKAAFDWVDEGDERDGGGGKEESGFGALPMANHYFQSLLELGQVPGFTQSLLREIGPYVTVHSGLNSVHPQLVEPSLLSYVPELDIQDPNLADELKNADSLDEALLNQIKNQGLLQDLVDEKESPSWELEINVTPKGGFQERFTAIIARVDGAKKPYRVLELRGPIDQVS